MMTDIGGQCRAAIQRVLDGTHGPRLRRPLPPVVWHYTAEAGAAGILESGDIWASHVSTLNDHAEVKHALSVIAHRIEAGQWPVTIARLTDLIEHALAREPDQGWHIASFSASPDIFTQWCRYADHGTGAALGFDASRLAAWAKDRGADLAPVTYDPEIQAAAIDALLAEAAHLLNDFPADAALPAIAAEAVFLLPILKHRSWQQEAEWRLMVPLVEGHSLQRVETSSSRIAFPLLIGGWRMPLAAVRLGHLSPHDPLAPSPHSWLERASAMGATIDRAAPWMGCPPANG